MNWSRIEKELKKNYSPGQKQRGQKAYKPILLLKMQLISIWYGFSDVQTEEMVNDSLSMMKFCGLSLEDNVPDHSTLSRFRSELTRLKAYDRLLKSINKQVSKHDLIVKNGVKVDASLTQSPFTPKGKPTYEIATDRQEEERSNREKAKEKEFHQIKKIEHPGSDHDARWVKKSGKTIYAYKKHIATDDNGMIMGVSTPPGQTNTIVKGYYH